jgi:hypothetical protein
MKKIKRILRSERREEKLKKKKGLVWFGRCFGYWFLEEKEKERKVKISIIGAKRETERFR